MRIEYGTKRDLLYLWLARPGTAAARTDILSPGVHADFDGEGNLLGIEVLDARSILGDELKFEVALTALT